VFGPRSPSPDQGSLAPRTVAPGAPLPWPAFAGLAPELAAAGARLLDDDHLAYLATTRRSGSPRLHPISPIRTERGLYVAVNERSPKRWDLARDGRYALHAPLGESDEEFVITGSARRIHDEVTRREITAAAGHTVHPEDWLFEFLIGRCLHGYWVDVGQPGTYPVYQQWPEAASGQAAGRPT
jgi:hypothetical protein